MESIVPTGYQVASTNTAGAGGIGDLLRRGLSGLIDVELSRRAASTPDRADVETVTGQHQPQSTAAADTLRAITPAQWAMLGVAGVLTVGLFAGWFR